MKYYWCLITTLALLFVSKLSAQHAIMTPIRVDERCLSEKSFWWYETGMAVKKVVGPTGVSPLPESVFYRGYVYLRQLLRIN